MNYSQFVGMGIMFLSLFSYGQQVPDLDYSPEWFDPPFTEGEGPTLAIDEGHHNFHTLGSGFRAFGNIAEAGGFKVIPHEGAFTVSSLEDIDILVIANPLNSVNVGNWTLPCPSAFTQNEIQVIDAWVENGGRLILIADHMPFGGAVEDLAQTFGLTWYNGFASIESPGPGDLLTEIHPFLNADSILNFRTFTGSAIEPSDDFHPLMELTEGDLNMTTIAWNFDSLNQRLPLSGKWQACWRTWGRGAVVCLGEAASLTSQLVGPDEIPVGVSMRNVGGNLGFIQDMLTVLSPSRADLLQVLDRLQKLAEALPSRSPSDVLEIYADDAQVIGPDTVIEPEQLQRYWSMFLRIDDWRLEPHEWSRLSDGRIRLTGRSVMTYGGEAKMTSTSYFDTYWREENGIWRIEEDRYDAVPFEIRR